MKALIIEDEALARQHMQKVLAEHFPQVEVVGTAGSVKDTVEWLSKNSADVIFMDVELSDGTCFDILSQVDVDASIIMTTAYDQYAVNAFKINAVDYLLKPIAVEDISRALSRVEYGADSAPAEPQHSATPREKFLIRLNDRIVPVKVSEIAYFFSESKNSYIVTNNNTAYVLDDSLDAIYERLDPAVFFRISRSCIISEGAIDSVSKLLGGRLRISLKRGIEANTDLTVSRARVDGFMSWLEA